MAFSQAADDADHQQHRSCTFSGTGFLRLRSIIGPEGPIPVSKTTWWAGVKSGRYPKPVKLAPRVTAWRVEDIHALIARESQSAESSHAS
jgi:predicted DNA-binding transcriptional regulator AlpA